jgi:hypothetical protein
LKATGFDRLGGYTDLFGELSSKIRPFRAAGDEYPLNGWEAHRRLGYPDTAA